MSAAGESRISQIIEDSIPLSWSPGIIRLCQAGPHTHGERQADGSWGQVDCPTPGKRPLDRGFNTTAAERWKRGGSVAFFQAAQEHLDAGGNLGMVPPPGVMIVDADTADTVEWLLDVVPAGTPVMQRTPSSAHFYLSFSPDLALKAKRIAWEADGKSFALDLRLAAKSQAVVPPSHHKSGIDYSWLSRLPEDIADVPRAPTQVEDVLRMFHRGARGEAARRHAAEMPGHDRLRHFVNRWCRYMRRIEDVRERAVAYAAEVYDGRPERLEQCLTPGGELDRLIESGWELYGGRAPLVEDKTDQGYVDLFLGTCDSYTYDLHAKVWYERQPSMLWEPSSDHAIQFAIGKMNEVLFDDAAREVADADRRDRLALMAKNLRMASKVNQIFIRMRHQLARATSQFDSNPDEVAFPATVGPAVVLNTRTLEERWATRDDLITMKMGTVYDSYTDVDMSLWRQFVQSTFGDTKTVSLVQRALGLSLLGRDKPHKLYFLFGRGGTGKSTFLTAIMHAFGDYAVKADFATFEGRGQVSGSTQTSDIARFKGKRLVVCSEIPDRGRLGARMKDLTGGDKVVARHLFGHPFEFMPTHSVWVAGNVAPEADFLDSGVERRLVVIPADNKPTAIDHRLGRKLLSAGVQSAIIAWAIEGLEQALEAEGMDPLGTAPAVEQAAQDYWVSMNPVEDWFRECVARGPGDVPTGDLYKAFLAWIEDTRGLKANNPHVPTVVKFGFALRRLGCGKRTAPGGKRLTTGVKSFHRDSRPGAGTANIRVVLPS